MEDDHAAFRAEVRSFLDSHAELRTGTDADWTRGVHSDDPQVARAVLQRCREWQRTLYDNGWAAIAWPKEFGGRGGTIAEMLVFEEEAARYDVTNGFFGVSQSLVGPPIMVHGTPEQQKTYLPGLLRGEQLWCQLFSEPGAGSDLAALATRAERDGDEFVVNGQKVWTSEAHNADLGILIARTDPQAPKHQGITFFIVDMHSVGVEVRPLRQATGSSHFNEVFLSDVRIPAENVVGELNGGWAVTRTVMSSESSMIGGFGATDPANFAALLGLARSHGLTDEPVLRQELAEAWIRDQIQRHLGLRFKTYLTSGRGVPPDPSVLKNVFTHANAQRAEAALGIEGPAGTLSGGDAPEGGLWQTYVMSQFASRIGGGTNEVHRNMIAERSLGLPRDDHGDRDRPWNETAR
jgi:alkylation response protein AidB-like acyl-CoA dehydrogenase